MTDTSQKLPVMPLTVFLNRHGLDLVINEDCSLGIEVSNLKLFRPVVEADNDDEKARLPPEFNRLSEGRTGWGDAQFGRRVREILADKNIDAETALGKICQESQQ